MKGPTMKRKAFKPRTWWTIYNLSQPLPEFVSDTRSGAMQKWFAYCSRTAAAQRSWRDWEHRGYTVGKITVSPVEGK